MGKEEGLSLVLALKTALKAAGFKRTSRALTRELRDTRPGQEKTKSPLEFLEKHLRSVGISVSSEQVLAGKDTVPSSSSESERDGSNSSSEAHASPCDSSGDSSSSSSLESPPPSQRRRDQNGELKSKKESGASASTVGNALKSMSESSRSSADSTSSSDDSSRKSGSSVSSASSVTDSSSETSSASTERPGLGKRSASSPSNSPATLSKSSRASVHSSTSSSQTSSSSAASSSDGSDGASTEGGGGTRSKRHTNASSSSSTENSNSSGSSSSTVSSAADRTMKKTSGKDRLEETDSVVSSGSSSDTKRPGLGGGLSGGSRDPISPGKGKAERNSSDSNSSSSDSSSSSESSSSSDSNSSGSNSSDGNNSDSNSSGSNNSDSKGSNENTSDSKSGDSSSGDSSVSDGSDGTDSGASHPGLGSQVSGKDTIMKNKSEQSNGSDKLIPTERADDEHESGSLKRSTSAGNVACPPSLSAGNSKKRRRSDIELSKMANAPFKRVREEQVSFRNDRLRDNSFFSKGDTYGLRAHQDLSITRGKGFRKAMTKKKRQNHHGGTLDAGNVSSYKFSDSDSD